MTIAVTLAGRAIARSGLLPVSADELLRYASQRADALAALGGEATPQDSDALAFLLLHAAFSCSEYGGRAVGARRILPYQLLARRIEEPPAHVRHLAYQPSQDDAVNAAVLARRWVGGAPMKDLEAVLSVRSGALRATFADAAGILRGWSDILYSVTSPRSRDALPSAIVALSLDKLAAVVGPMRRLAVRLDLGLPEEVTWLATVSDTAGAVLT